MKAIRLHIFRHHFIFKLTSFLVGLSLLLLLISLGVWQLHRADEKKMLLSHYENRLHNKPLSIHQLRDKMDLDYHPITVRGHYDNRYTFLLDNKVHQHRVGYQVLTLFVLEQGKEKVLINRGWVPRGASRADLPKIKSEQRMLTLEGFVYFPSKKGLVLGGNVEASSEWPKRVQQLHMTSLTNELNTPVYPFIILLSGDSPTGFVREWRPVAGVSVAKHIGYAVQWFLFALIFMVIFFLLHRQC